MAAPPDRQAEQVELSQGAHRVVVTIGDGETLAEAAYRTLQARISDEPELRLLLDVCEAILQEAFATQRAQRAVRPAAQGERMSQLAEAFPTLVGRPGVRPWAPETFIGQLDETWAGSGARAALKFVAHVWNIAHPFDLKDFSKWDTAHRGVFARWAADPWWA